MEAIQLQSAGRQPIGNRGVARAAERRRGAKAHIIEQHDQHIGGTRGWAEHGDRRILRIRVFGVIRCHADMVNIRDRQDLPRRRLRRGLSPFCDGPTRRLAIPVSRRIRHDRYLLIGCAVPDHTPSEASDNTSRVASIQGGRKRSGPGGWRIAARLAFQPCGRGL